MVKIKICGIKNMEEIKILNRYRPDYAGFIFYPESKRYITPLKAHELIKNLHPAIKKTGVFVNHPADEVNEISKQLGLDIVQIHGDEKPDYFKNLDTPYWKVFRIGDKLPDDLDQYQAEAYLFDTLKKNTYGGSGSQFDQSILNGIDKNYKVIIAGGLCIVNIAKTLKTIIPYCVDINSGVETDGFKDDEKVMRMIRFIREYTGNEVHNE
ncbi:MAG: phosphoribosylanthranilate isomerase [Clostridia bacterium]|nr:phosphoribosylanthranilate isomerase [Clostridia bacterium]